MATKTETSLTNLVINYLSEKTKEILKLFYIAKIIPKLSIIFEKLQKITLHYATIFCII